MIVIMESFDWIALLIGLTHTFYQNGLTHDTIFGYNLSVNLKMCAFQAIFNFKLSFLFNKRQNIKKKLSCRVFLILFITSLS